MLQTLKKFFAFCGVDNRRLFITSIWLGVVSAICSAMRIPAAAIVIQALLERNVTMATLWTSLGIIVISLIITIAINIRLPCSRPVRATAPAPTNASRSPSTCDTCLWAGSMTTASERSRRHHQHHENMANVATRVVMVTTRGFLTSGIIAVMMFLFDWRMGLIRWRDWCCSSPSTPPCSARSSPFPADVQCRRAACLQGAGNMCRASPRSRIST